MLAAVTIEPTVPATKSVIWMHGLGADGHDFEPVVPHLGLPVNHAIRFVFPHAPVRPVTLNGGMPMPAWFDVADLNFDISVKEADVLQAREQVIALIKHENSKGVASENIVLAGFSQGGALALCAGLCYPEKLAGIMGLSTFLPLLDILVNDLSPIQQQTPIFIGHGNVDPLVPLSYRDKTLHWLQEKSYAISSHTYAMDHSVCMEELQDIGLWLGKVLA